MVKGSTVPFRNSGDFLSWWFESPRLDGRAADTFKNYYVNYERNFNGYLKQIWCDRHLELDKEIESLRKKSRAMILDLGCGTGSVSLYVAYKLEGQGEVLGVDINKERLFCAKERKRVLERNLDVKLRCEFSESNVLSLSEDQRFDLIYLEEAFHHMEPRLLVAKKISGLLKDEGVLVVSESNAYNPFMQLRLLRKRGISTIKRELGEGGETYLYGIERIMRPRLVAKLFCDNNLKTRSFRYFRMAPATLGNLADRRGIDLLKLETRMSKIVLFSRIFSVHYNFVFQKERAH